MRLRVVGWTDYKEWAEDDNCGWAARHAIVDDIKKNGYFFSGEAHQYEIDCVPVLNDGKEYQFSQREWGGIMAEAQGVETTLGYALYAWGIDKKHDVYPNPDGKKRFPYIKERNLNQQFTVEVTKEVFDAAVTENKITIDDLPKLRYLDNKDRLVLKCGDQKAKYIVENIDRDKDIPPEKLKELRERYNKGDYKQKAKAEKEFYSAKDIMIIKLRLPKTKNKAK